jgi:hypothetical protein
MSQEKKKHKTIKKDVNEIAMKEEGDEEPTAENGFSREKLMRGGRIET